MARRLRVVRNPGQLEVGQWIPTHAVKFNDNGSVSMMTENRTSNRGRRRRRRNIAAGFYDEFSGVFHPIRASYDYSRPRAGEPPLKKRNKAKKRKKATAKKATRRKSRRR